MNLKFKLQAANETIEMQDNKIKEILRDNSEIYHSAVLVTVLAFILGVGTGIIFGVSL